MPFRPKKPCAFPRCRNISISGKAYCIDHKELNSDGFNNKRSESHKWYYIKTWKRLRELKLRKNPFCEESEKEGKLIPATVVDHIKDWKKGKTEDERWNLFTDMDNLQALSPSKHNAKTARTNK